jgi:hypothetical protein
LLFPLYVVACITNAIITIIGFVQYVRYRMAERPESAGPGPAEHDRLNRLEKKWQSIHFITLALFVFFGVLICVQLSHRYNTPHINY